jgi:hypothetical protein
MDLRRGWHFVEENEVEEEEIEYSKNAITITAVTGSYRCTCPDRLNRYNTQDRQKVIGGFS